MVLRFIAYACLVFLSLPANSSIITGSNTSDGYNFQSLEWLSLNVTKGLTKTEILSGFIGNDGLAYTYSESADINNGAWRYATAAEIYHLIDYKNLIAETANPFPQRKFYTAFNWFNDKFGHFQNPNSGTGVENWGEKTSTFWFGQAGTSGQMTLTSGSICLGCSISNSIYKSENGYVGSHSLNGLYSYNAPIGSLLVRSAKVPAPATFSILSIALIFMLLRARIWVLHSSSTLVKYRIRKFNQ